MGKSMSDDEPWAVCGVPPGTDMEQLGHVLIDRGWHLEPPSEFWTDHWRGCPEYDTDDMRDTVRAGIRRIVDFTQFERTDVVAIATGRNMLFVASFTTTTGDTIMWGMELSPEE